MSDIDSKIQEILDKESIRDLVHLYCRAADRHDHVLMRELYHEDAYDDHGSFFKGKAMEFIDMLPEIQKSMGILHHNVTTHNIKLMGDKAEGETYIIAFHQVLAETGNFDVLIGGRYFDEYQKREGLWKFSSRAVDADWAYEAGKLRRQMSELETELWGDSGEVFCRKGEQGDSLGRSCC